LDNKTFEAWLNDQSKQTGFSSWLPTFQARIGGSGGFEPGQVSLLHMAWTQRVGPQSETPERWLLCGGAGQIPQKLMDGLSERVNLKLNVEVKSIRQHAAGVDVFCVDRTKGSSWSQRANAVIVAIPPPLRRFIHLDLADGTLPEIEKKYDQFSWSSEMGRMSKVHAVYDNAFWRANCLSGSGAGNLIANGGDFEFCQFVADSSPPNEKPGILTSFISSDANTRLTNQIKDKFPGKAFSSREVQDFVKGKVLEDFFRWFQDTRIKTDVRDFVYQNWDETEFPGGAYTSYPKPGIWTSAGDVGWRKPIGDIFWAGTETADRWPGYFDGAISAGKAAAAQVIAKWQWPTADEEGKEPCGPLGKDNHPLCNT
jgi:monoamine oxidase